MKYRELDILVLEAGERTRVTKSGSHLVFTTFAVEQFVKAQPSAVPLMTNHSGEVAHRAGHVVEFYSERVGATTRLMARARLTDLAVEVAEGQPVSLGVLYATEATRIDDRDGYKRVNRFTCRELSLLTDGSEPGAMASARVLKVGPVVGTDDAPDAPPAPGSAASAWAAAGLTIGESTIVAGGQVNTVK